MTELPQEFNDLMMAQQPIFTRSNKLFGYELLFRNQDEEMANVIDGEHATSEVIVNLCMGITELEAQLRTPFFINITRDLLMSDAFFPIDPKLVYIEILEGQKITRPFVMAIQKWRKAGYRFVLDDYQFTPSYQLLVPLATMVKIDVLATPPSEYEEEIKAMHEKGIILVAEKVENQEMFEFCKSLGFKLFQGYYLQRPNVIKGKRIHSNMQFAVELVSELNNENITIDKVAALVAKDPKLSYQLLRILNSPLCGIPRKVESLREAVVYIGLKQIRKWAFLITLASSSDQPIELFRILLTRARSCQLLCLLHGGKNDEADFTAGIMSGIDAVLGMKRDVVLAQIALESTIVNAIVNLEGEIGGRLKLVYALEQSNWAEIAKLPHQEKLILSRTYGEAVLWADGMLKAIA